MQSHTKEIKKREMYTLYVCIFFNFWYNYEDNRWLYMKKVFKSLIFIVLAICPFIIKASGLNYEDTIHYVNNYIYKFPKYSNYLFFDDRLPFIYEKTDFVYDSKFKSGGLLSKTEFEIFHK